jgi:hypothetical protein
MQGWYWLFLVNQFLLFLLSIFITNQRAIMLCISDCYVFIFDPLYVYGYTRSLTDFIMCLPFYYCALTWAIYTRIKSRLVHWLDYSALSATSDKACVQLHRQPAQHWAAIDLNITEEKWILSRICSHSKWRGEEWSIFQTWLLILCLWGFN